MKYLKNLHFDFVIVNLIIFLLIYSLCIIWSASNQNTTIIISKIIQNMIGFIIMIFLAQISPKFYQKWSFIFYIIYITLLILVIFFGENSRGSQRWLNIFSIIRFQPSEIGKIIVPLFVSYFLNKIFFYSKLKKTILCFFLFLSRVV